MPIADFASIDHFYVDDDVDDTQTWSAPGIFAGR